MIGKQKVLYYIFKKIKTFFNIFSVCFLILSQLFIPVVFVLSESIHIKRQESKKHPDMISQQNA